MEHIDQLLEKMIAAKAADLYLTHGSPAALRVEDAIVPIGAAITDDDLARYLSQLLSEGEYDDYRGRLELNTALLWNDDARFRVNVYRQQGHDSIVIRRIEMRIPKIDELHLPALYGDLSLLKRGLILICGPTGAGKTTSLAAMIGHRNTHGSGHIITVEDPIEFVHQHNHCIISQRDVGLDTYSYEIALKNALRQRPDMVVIGEVRDREVMEQAIYFAETGHLCVTTMHANNASQAIERILNFFPEERHKQILMNLALNLRAVLSQRLVTNVKGTRTLVAEVMLNSGLIRQLIEEGKIRQIREMIEKGRHEGMQTFDQCLIDLYNKHVISEQVALAESDTPSTLRMQINSLKGAEKSAAQDVLIRQHHRIVQTDF